VNLGNGNTFMNYWFTKDQWETAFRKAGLKDVKWFIPYPEDSQRDYFAKAMRNC
jgi:hypothetical protein